MKTVTKRSSLENQTFGDEEMLLKIVQGEYFSVKQNPGEPKFVWTVY